MRRAPGEAARTFAHVRFPLGIQTYSEIVRGGYVYVDKTRHLARVADAGKYFFFSRPRRFGKSLTLSTYAALFGGDRELFAGTWAYDHWDFAAEHTAVVWLQFASASYREEGLEKGLRRLVRENAERLGVEVVSDDPPAQQLRQVIRAVGAERPCVLLVDEYDKPITDYLDDAAQRRVNRDHLRPFFGVLKDLDAYLRLVFVTGISAFSRVSLFSDLNNITDLTLSPLAYELVGVTEAELGRYFGGRLDDIGADRAEVRRRYNGYWWGGGERVYNPWTLLSYLFHGRHGNYWVRSGTPHWLPKMVRDSGRVDPSGEVLAPFQLTAIEFDRLHLATLLFQTGYLTVAEELSPYELRLDYPNVEVREALDLLVLAAYTEEDIAGGFARVGRLRRAFDADDLATVIEVLDATLARLPYDIWARQEESAFHAIAFLLFDLLGVIAQAEAHSAGGRTDVTVQTATHVYAFEFKVGATAAEALAQVHDRGYLRPFGDDARTRVAVEVSFDKDGRRVGEWAHETL